MSGRTCLVAGGILVGLMSASGAGAEPLKLGHSTWVGYGPLYIAQEYQIHVDASVPRFLLCAI